MSKLSLEKHHFDIGYPVEIIDTEEEEEEVEIPPDEMLKIITEYLRTDYLFCIWCGITFENADDLNSNCPGNSRDDHDD